MTRILMSPRPEGAHLILASGSAARRDMLKSAGLTFEIQPADVDEAAIRDRLLEDGADVADGATALAEAKALAVSRMSPDAWVIGADQILECGGRWYEKAETLDQAQANLVSLQNRPHRLISAVAVARNGDVPWRHADQAELVVRPLGDAFLDTYLKELGDDALTSVGGYHIEGLGAQLLKSVKGDYFTILGLPLLALLDHLRGQGILES